VIEAIEFGSSDEDTQAAIQQACVWNRLGIECLLLGKGNKLLLVTREEYDHKRWHDYRLKRLPIIEIFRAKRAPIDD